MTSRRTASVTPTTESAAAQATSVKPPGVAFSRWSVVSPTSASWAQGGGEVCCGEVNDASCRGNDVGADSGDAESDAAEEVDRRDLPVEIAEPQANEPSAHLDVRQITGDEETD